MRGWEDLGEDRPPPEPPAVAAERHAIVGKFYDTFSGAGNVDRGRPLASVKDPKVFRIRSGGWRAAVRYTPEEGVVWLCRALSLAAFHDESDAYDEFGRLFDIGALLPTDDEQERARADYFLVGAVLALSQARVNADNDPGRWWAAVATRADGSQNRIGRIYAERETDEAGDYVTRFILLVTSPPSDVTLRPDWREFLLAQILRDDEPIVPAYHGLPAGTDRQANEIPYVQAIIELRDETEAAAEEQQ